MTRQRGFTLVELLVSIGIFATVSAMMAIVLTSVTRLYRGAEAARAAGEEAVLATAMLRQDLALLLGPGEEGWFWAATGPDDGSGTLAFAISSPDPAQSEKKVVTWWIHGTALYRREEPWPVGATAATARTIMNRPPTAFAGAQVVTRNALHLGLWIADQDFSLRGRNPFRRPTVAGLPDWEQADPAGGSRLGPWAPQGGDDGSWESFGGSRAPWPSALRVSITLAGSSASVQDSSFVAAEAAPGDTTLRYRGGVLPAGNGAVVRIGDEWLAVTGIESPGTATVERGRRRSTPETHARGAPILQGQTYSVVWRLGD